MSPNSVRWLYGELPGLVGGGVIGEETAAALRRHYGPLPESGARRTVFLIFGVLGALLVGSGVILLLAHNWEELSRPLRAGLAVTPLLIAQGIALWTAMRRSDSPAWTEGSATLLSLSVVACISLISQTYNMGGDLQGLLLTAVALTLPLAYVLRSRVAATLSWAGATWWWMLGPWPAAPRVSYAIYAGFIVLAAPFVGRLLVQERDAPRSALVGWTVCGSLGVGLIRLGASPEIGLWAPLYAGLLGSSYVFGLRLARDAEETAAWRRPFHTFGALGLAVLLIVCSFREVWTLSWDWSRAPETLFPLVVATGVALALLLGASWAGIRLLVRGRWDHGLLACTPILVTAGWAVGLRQTHATAIMAAINLWALAVGVAVCTRGIRAGRLTKANGGLLLILAVLVVRFFDADISFVARGIAFIVLGSGFLATNAWLVRRSREVRS